MDFPGKLQFTLGAKENSPKVSDGQALFDCWINTVKVGRQTGKLRNRIKGIMFKFYEQGKKEGYIEESIPFELLYLYPRYSTQGLGQSRSRCSSTEGPAGVRSADADLLFWGVQEEKGKRNA